MKKSENKVIGLGGAVKEGGAEEKAVAPAKKKEAAPVVLEVKEVGVIAPCVTGPVRGYMSSHVEVQLRGPQKSALVALREGLVERRARLESGKVVSNGGDAVRWLLEQVGAGIGLGRG